MFPCPCRRFRHGEGEATVYVITELAAHAMPAYATPRSLIGEIQEIHGKELGQVKDSFQSLDLVLNLWEKLRRA